MDTSYRQLLEQQQKDIRSFPFKTLTKKEINHLVRIDETLEALLTGNPVQDVRERTVVYPEDAEIDAIIFLYPDTIPTPVPLGTYDVPYGFVACNPVNGQTQSDIEQIISKIKPREGISNKATIGVVTDLVLYLKIVHLGRNSGIEQHYPDQAKTVWEKTYGQLAPIYLPNATLYPLLADWSDYERPDAIAVESN